MTCSICLDAINATTGQVVMSCGHNYHLKCISSWLTTADTCPNCRAKPSTYETLLVHSETPDTESWNVRPIQFDGTMSIFRGFNFNAAEDVQDEPTTDENFGMSLQALFNSDDNIDMSLIHDERDIEIVVSQASVSRNLACIALTSNNGDIVNAIIELLSPASW